MRLNNPPRRRVAGPLAFALGLLGCGHGNYVWVDALGDLSGQSALEGAYAIASGDLLNIRVYSQDTISTRGRVSPDGTIAIPLVGQLEARGLSVVALSRLIEARLKAFVVAPSVTILVEEAQPVKVAVVGEVGRPAVLTVTPGTPILQVLALAGGLTEYADRDSIFLLRERPARAPLRIRFTYHDLTRGVGRAANFRVEAGDTVVVE
jgi:polysaccharide export outer membrane protein